MTYCIRYTEGDTSAICEVEGDTCFDTFKTRAEAEAAAQGSNRDAGKLVYFVERLPEGLRDGLAGYDPHGRTLADFLTKL